MDKLPIVIIINGSGGVGKSTFIKLCKTVDTSVTELSIVDYVKNIAYKIGWKGEKTEKARKFLANLKDTIFNYNENIIWNDIDNKIKLNPNKIYFINARSPKDIDYLAKKYKAKTLLITNHHVPLIHSNHADAKVLNYSYNYWIKNDGNFNDLLDKAIKFMDMIKNT